MNHRADRVRADERTREGAAEGRRTRATGALGLLDRLGNRGLAAARARIQAKADGVSTPDDPLEILADRVADEVVSRDAPPIVGPAPPPMGEPAAIQREPLPGTEAENASSPGTPGPPVASAPPRDGGGPSPHGSAASGLLAGLDAGSPLPDPVRGFMEDRFGRSFSDVRVHTGDRAAHAAASVSAKAFTVGSEIVFGAGWYAPESDAGKRLVAHELAHVVQQGGATYQGPGSEATTEQDADDAAHAVVAGGHPDVRSAAIPGTVQRDGDKGSAHPVVNREGTVTWESGPLTTARGVTSAYEAYNSWNPGNRTHSVGVGVIHRSDRNRKPAKFPGADADVAARNVTIVVSYGFNSIGTDGPEGKGAMGFHPHATLVLGKPPKVSPKPKPKPDPEGPPEPPAPGEEPQEHDPVRPREPYGGSGGGSGTASQVDAKSKTDPDGALDDAGSLPQGEMRKVGGDARKKLLKAAARRPDADPSLPKDLITTTPDADAGAVSDALHENGGQLLQDLKDQAGQVDPQAASDLDDAVRDLDGRRKDAPVPDGPIEWTPELEKKAEEVRKAIKNLAPKTKIDPNQNMEGRESWKEVKDKTEAFFGRVLKNIEYDRNHLDENSSVLGTDARLLAETAALRGAVEAGLAEIRAAKTPAEFDAAYDKLALTIRRARGEIEGKQRVERLESRVRSWNKTQSGIAAVPAFFSNLFGGVSGDEPDRIAARTNTEVETALEELRNATTPEALNLARAKVDHAIRKGERALSLHQDEVYKGAEITIVAIKVTAGVATVVVAAPVAATYGAAAVTGEMVIGGAVMGGGLNAVGQGIEMAEGTRKEFSVGELGVSTVVGGALPYAPWAAAPLMGLGQYNTLDAYDKGHYASMAFNAGTMAAPLVVKEIKLPDLPPSLRSKLFALRLATSEVGVGIENVPGLGGRNPTTGFPYEPGIAMMAEGPTTGPRLPGVAPETNPLPGFGPWETGWKPGGALPGARPNTPVVIRIGPNGELVRPAAPHADLVAASRDAARLQASAGDYITDPGSGLVQPRQASLFDIAPSARGPSTAKGQARVAEWNRLMRSLYEFQPKPNQSYELNGNLYHFDGEARLVRVSTDKPMLGARHTHAYADHPNKTPGYDYGHVGGVSDFGTNDLLLGSRGGYPLEAGFNRSGAWRSAEQAMTVVVSGLRADGKQPLQVSEVRNFVNGIPSEWRLHVVSDGQVVYDSGWLLAPLPPASP